MSARRMATYYTRFACVLPLGTSENVACARAAFAAYERALATNDEDVPAFCVVETTGDAGPELLITSGEGSGDPDQVAAFVGLVGRSCGLAGPWGFVWGYSCDRNRTDGFGGGAVVLDLATGEILDFLSCDRWLIARLGNELAAPVPR